MPIPRRARKNQPTHLQLSLAYRDIAKLQPDSQNPRLHSEKQVQQIADSIEAFGFNVPFLVDRDLQLIAGHGRLQACKLLGIKRVPTIRLDHLSEEQRRAFMIADNRLTENSRWDDRLLGEQLKALSEVDLDFSLEAIGFEMGEIDLMIEGLAEVAEDPEADTLPEIDSAVSVSKAGDLWLLGKNRLICGDALTKPTYRRLMQGQLANAVFTDPPYNDPIDGFVTGSGKRHHAEFAMASGEMTSAEFRAFLTQAFSHLAASTVPGSIHFVCMDWRHMQELLSAGEQVYTELKNVCVWIKDSGGLGSLYRSQHELVFVFKNGDTKHRNNVQLGKFGRNRTNVWQYSRVNVGSKSREGPPLKIHPTLKPVEMVADAILDCTARGDIVLDAFLGSGTTLVAAERVNRICYGIELEPAYVDLAVRRWESFTGTKAQHATSKRSFQELEEVARDTKK